MSSRFDQVAPELVRHLNVHLSNGEVVAALLFSTDRAPYVVKNGGGSPELEVPIREGTRTRSARRDELLRMLVPAVSVPPALLLEASLRATWYSRMEGEEGYVRDESTVLWAQVSVFLEHTGPHAVLLPTHEMSGSLRAGELHFALEPSIVQASQNEPPPPSFGVSRRTDGVAATGPGRFDLRLKVVPPLAGDHRAAIGAVPEWQMVLLLGVTGATGRIRLDATLSVDSSPGYRFKSEAQEDVGRWLLAA